jgi:hypothetical protein
MSVPCAAQAGRRLRNLRADVFRELRKQSPARFGQSSPTPPTVLALLGGSEGGFSAFQQRWYLNTPHHHLYFSIEKAKA